MEAVHRCAPARGMAAVRRRKKVGKIAEKYEFFLICKSRAKRGKKCQQLLWISLWKTILGPENPSFRLFFS